MENFDYLTVSDNDSQVLKNISKMSEHLKELKVEMLKTEALAKQAKQEYEHFANVVLPSAMFSAGLESVELASGGIVKVKHNFYCQPNKNPEDRAKIVAWLREHGGAHLVTHDATVASEDFDKLASTGIPFIENASVNTAKLKSFLKAGVLADTGIQQFTMEDIPACIHFTEVTTVEIDD